MKMEHARFITYLLAAGVGAAITILGAVKGDATLMATGMALLGTGGLAGANTYTTTIPRGKHAAE